MDIAKVAEAIKYLRNRAGYTQKDLAARLGVSDKAVSKWERGLGLPDVSLLGRLSVLLDTDTDSLLAGDVIHHDMNWKGLLILDENKYGIGPETIVYDKPLVYYLLSYFLLVGIKQIKIICRESDRAYIESEFLKDDAIDIVLSFGQQVSDAVEDSGFMQCKNLMVVFGRSFLYGVDQTRFFQRAMVNRDRLTVLALPKGNRDSFSVIQFDANKKIVPYDHEERLVTQYNYCDIPILFCPTDLFEVLYKPSGDKYDISRIFSGQDVYIEVLDRGFFEIEMNTWESISEVSNFVKIVQKHCGMILYCVEEVAWRRGMIHPAAMKARGERRNGTEYGEYLLSLVRDIEKVNG